MKVFHSVEELAKSEGISERTGWRWLKSGKVLKEKDENGQNVYVLVEEATPDITDVPTTDADNGVVGDMAEGGFGRKKGKTQGVVTRDIIAPTTFPPDEAMIGEAKETYKMEQRERQERAKRGIQELRGDEENPFVSERRAAFQGKKFSLEEYKVDKELRTLQAEDKEEEKKRERKEMIERIKLNVVPQPLRLELPPNILLETLNAISLALTQLDTSLLDESEIQTYAEIVRNRLWSNEQWSGEIRFAQTRAIFKCLDASMHEQHHIWRESKIQSVVDVLEEEGIDEKTVRDVINRSGEFSYDSFLNQFFLDLMVEDPGRYSELSRSMSEFLCLNGRRDIIEKNIEKVAKLSLGYMEGYQGGDNLPS